MPSWEDFEKIVKSVTAEEEFKNLKLSTDFIAKLIKARIDKNITQAELAARAGLKQSAIARIENQGSIPRLDTLLRIIEALEMEIDFVPQNASKEDKTEKLVNKIANLENLIIELTKTVKNLQKETNPEVIIVNNGEWSPVNAYKSRPIKEESLTYNIVRRGEGRYEKEYQ